MTQPLAAQYCWRARISPWKVEISGVPLVGIMVPSARITRDSIANRLKICAVD
jgi:hypothetical protein